ncbi:MAG TPA: hypothetical protein VFJ13_05855 [Paracoccaceae bacterium]|nr:hypothetical protein [Paracoccaceae bacterium]
MTQISNIGFVALLAGMLAAPLALAQDQEPEAPAAGETMPGTMGEGGMPGMMGEEGTPGMMGEGGMPMMGMMRMMQQMAPMMDACLAMMEEHGESESAPDAQGG